MWFWGCIMRKRLQDYKTIKGQTISNDAGPID